MHRLWMTMDGMDTFHCRIDQWNTQMMIPFQIIHHEHSLSSLRKELDRLHSNAPPVRSKGKEVEKYFFNQRLLMLEVRFLFT